MSLLGRPGTSLVAEAPRAALPARAVSGEVRLCLTRSDVQILGHRLDDLHTNSHTSLIPGRDCAVVVQLVQSEIVLEVLCQGGQESERVRQTCEM